MSHFERVKEFNQTVLGIDPRQPGLQDLDEAKLSHRQLLEEASEYIVANFDADFISAIDGVIDGLVFGYGILYKLGLNETQVDKIFNAVMDANMTKVRGVKVGREGFDAADAIKPDGWLAPEVRIEKILEEE